jgi:hypothetical protein
MTFYEASALLGIISKEIGAQAGDDEDGRRMLGWIAEICRMLERSSFLLEMAEDACKTLTDDANYPALVGALKAAIDALPQTPVLK